MSLRLTDLFFSKLLPYFNIVFGGKCKYSNYKNGIKSTLGRTEFLSKIVFG